YAVYLAPQDIKLGVRESVPDVARNLSRWVDGIMARVFSHDTVVGLAENASVPVINGLCDLEHPCQILADFMTIYEHKKRFEGLTLAWVGDGNNVCHSLLLASGLMGVNMRVATPEGYEPKEEIVKVAKEYAERSGAEIEILHSPQDAVKDADIIYTDVWASMGQESEAEKRKRIFMNYQVNPELVKLAKPDYIFMHCLPAHRGEEVTDEVLDGPNSVVLDEAENRLHAQKALLVKLMSR
ncbi:ornithine carbamoyltransferase, partial [bacterium]